MEEGGLQENFLLSLEGGEMEKGGYIMYHSGRDYKMIML